MLQPELNYMGMFKVRLKLASDLVFVFRGSLPRSLNAEEKMKPSQKSAGARAVG